MNVQTPLMLTIEEQKQIGRDLATKWLGEYPDWRMCCIWAYREAIKKIMLRCTIAPHYVRRGVVEVLDAPGNERR